MTTARLAVVALVLLVTAPTWPVVLGSATFWYRDIHLFHVPQRVLIASFLRSGRLPLWDPFLHAGSALWANPNNVVLHPSNLLYLIASPARAFGIGTALHLVVGALGAFALSRRLGASVPAATSAGAAFSLSGPVLSLVCLHPLFLAICLLPALCWAWDRWLAGGSSGLLALCALIVALDVTTGGAEACICTGITLAGWTLARESTRGLATRFAGGLLVLATALALSAPAWHPVATLMGQSPRGHGFPWVHSMSWSVHPARLPELVVPGLLGDCTTTRAGAYWGQALEGESSYMLSLYFGPLVIALAITGALCGELPRGIRRLLVTLAIAGLVVALGKNLPGAAALGETGLRLPSRYPVKAMMLIVLPLALLSAAGVDAVGQRRAWRANVVGLVSLSTLLVIAGGMLARSPSLGQRVGAIWFRAPLEDPAALGPVLERGGLLALLGALACIACLRADSILGRWPVVVASCFALLWGALPVNPTTDAARFWRTPPLAATVSHVVGEGRLYRSDTYWRRVVSEDPGDPAQARFERDALSGCSATHHGIPVAFHSDLDGLAAEREGVVAAAFVSLTWPERLQFLSSAGVTAILTDASIEGTRGIERISPLEGSPDPELRLYRLREGADAARFVARARVVPDDVSAIAAMRSADHDPRAEVVLLGQGEPKPQPACTGTVAPSFVSREPTQDFAIDAGCDGFVVLAIPFQPNLEATVDGVPARLVPGDVVFCAVAVPAGHHVLRWRYRIASLRKDMLASAIGLVAMGLMVAGHRRTRGDGILSGS